MREVIRYLRSYGRRRAGETEEHPRHIADALCSGADPVAEYVHRAITEPSARMPRAPADATTEEE